MGERVLHKHSPMLGCWMRSNTCSRPSCCQDGIRLILGSCIPAKPNGGGFGCLHPALPRWDFPMENTWPQSPTCAQGLAAVPQGARAMELERAARAHRTGAGGGEGRTGGEGVLLPPRRQHSPWMPLTVRYCYHLTALGETIFVIQPCLSQPAARPSVGFHGKLPSKTRRKGVTAGVTQPQLEASADEAEKGENLPTGSVPIGQRDLGTPPDTSCSSLVCPNPSTLQVGARPKGDALCKSPRNASPFRSTPSPADCIRPCSPLAVGEEE